MADENRIEGLDDETPEQGVQVVYEDEVITSAAIPTQESAGEKRVTNEAGTFRMPMAGDRLPGWAKWPEGLRAPRGVAVMALHFRGSLTATPSKGDRQCLVWVLTEGDEKMAFGRAMGDSNRASSELVKQMVRAIDGVPVDWSGMPGTGNPDAFWREIGPKYRNVLQRIFSMTHVVNQEELRDFFENCIAVVNAG